MFPDTLKTFILYYCCIIITIIKATNPITNIDHGGDLNLVLILNSSNNSGIIRAKENAFIHSAKWLINRLNSLELTYQLSFGLSVYRNDSDVDYLDIIVDTYKTNLNNNRNYILGIVSTNDILVLDNKIEKISNILNVPLLSIKNHYEYMVRAVIKLLNRKNLRDNILLITRNDGITHLFYQYAQKIGICFTVRNEIRPIVNSSTTYQKNNNDTITSDVVVVFFETASVIEEQQQQQIANDAVPLSVNKQTNSNEMIMIVVPIDANVPEVPDGSFIILPLFSDKSEREQNHSNLVPTPLFFDLAVPFLDLILSAIDSIKNCNESTNCLRHHQFYTQPLKSTLTPSIVMEKLQIEPVADLFVYEIFQKDSLVKNGISQQSKYKKLFIYSIFQDKLIVLNDTLNANQTYEVHSKSTTVCINRHFLINNNRVDSSDMNNIVSIHLRTESWIYAFLSLALLGMVLCIGILIFFLTILFQKRVLEGNPVLTLLLLFSVVLIYATILPFSFTSSIIDYNEILCTIKFLTTTLSCTLVFALLLSRAILLSSADREIGFISHIAGPVQSFLFLFIFSVQTVLNLQIIGQCMTIFLSYKLIYLMSYNVLLLIFLLCLIPLIYKSQRNYREGKYFSIAIILIFITWCIWIPCFLWLNDNWKEFIICSALISTGSICLAVIFIPRTYLLTIAAEREKINSTLPSLATATSAVDLYRVHCQPIYDCINIPTINAANRTTAMAQLQQPDLYSCPALPENIDFNLQRVSPLNNDKITRF